MDLLFLNLPAKMDQILLFWAILIFVCLTHHTSKLILLPQRIASTAQTGIHILENKICFHYPNRNFPTVPALT